MRTQELASSDSAPVAVTASDAAPEEAPSQASHSLALYAVVFGSLMAFGPFTIDLYLPAFPAIEADLITTEAFVQLTLTATLIGFGFGQLLIGPLSDVVGRRRPLIVATSLHFLASLAIMFAPTIEWVMFGRIVQGIGAAGSGVLAMAMVRDLFDGQPLVRMLARMALITALAPILAPVIGSQLMHIMSWRGLFGVLAAFGLIMTAVAALQVGETLPAERRVAANLRAIGGRYRALLGDRVFLGAIIISGMVFSTMFLYLSWSSFIYQYDFGLSAQEYGALFAANAIGLAICAQISGYLMSKFAPTKVMVGWLVLMLSSTIALLVANGIGAPPAVLIALVFLVLASIGGTNPTVQVIAMSRHGAQAGTAAALIGVFNFGLGGVIAPVVGIFGVSVAAMATGMIAVVFMALLSLLFVVRLRSVDVLS